jgi:hypothetical protein
MCLGSRSACWGERVGRPALVAGDVGGGDFGEILQEGSINPAPTSS